MEDERWVPRPKLDQALEELHRAVVIKRNLWVADHEYKGVKLTSFGKDNANKRVADARVAMHEVINTILAEHTIDHDN